MLVVVVCYFLCCYAGIYHQFSPSICLMCLAGWKFTFSPNICQVMTVYLKSFPFYFGQMLSCCASHFRQNIDGILQGIRMLRRVRGMKMRKFFKQFKIRFDVLVIKKLFVNSYHHTYVWISKLSFLNFKNFRLLWKEEEKFKSFPR